MRGNQEWTIKRHKIRKTQPRERHENTTKKLKT